ncbi:MAG: RNA polymerase sigma factor [Cyclobacteriaceae bacterium]
MLYKHFYGYAMSICLMYSSSKEDAVEVLNDGFLKVFKNLDHQKKIGSLKAWIRRIMVNTAIDRLRKDKRQLDQVPLEKIAYQLVSTIDPDDSYAQEILKMVQELSPAIRTVFNLYVIEGYSHKEISKNLNVTESTSRAHLSEANKKLRSQIKARLKLKNI